MVDSGNSGDNSRNGGGNMQPSAGLSLPKLPEEGPLKIVTCMNRCQTSDALLLSIHNVHIQKEVTEHVDIGGTYSQTTPEFWFYYTTTMRPHSFFLLNLFVCHRKTGSFSIGVPTTNKFVLDNTQCNLSQSLTLSHFRSTQNDECHFIKTFHFPYEKFKELGDDPCICLNIPINIQVDPLFTLNRDLLNLLKLQHSQGNELHKHTKPDFILKSVNGKEYPTHRLLLAAHSPVLRQLIKGKNSLCINSSDSTVELVLKFIYNETVEEACNRNVSELLDIVHKFQLKPLLILVDRLIDKEISVNNAVEMAIVAKKYKLDSIQNKVFNFIKNNPKVMKTEGWKQLEDAELAKAMFQYSLTEKTI